MSSSHNHRRILSKSMNKIGRLAEQGMRLFKLQAYEIGSYQFVQTPISSFHMLTELEAAKSLKTAEDTELDGTPFIDRLQLIRASADAIVYKCRTFSIQTCYLDKLTHRGVQS